MCCCCPPAINALFCLWCQSGCSKASVAGALTFFPPDPPLYKFRRLSAEGGEELPDDKGEPVVEEYATSAAAEAQEAMDEEGDENNDDISLTHVDGDEGIEGVEDDDEPIEPSSSRTTSSSSKNGKKQKQKSPAAQLTERAAQLRKRAAWRNARDARDAGNGVAYEFVPDPRLPETTAHRGSCRAVKVPSKRGSNVVHIAALIYLVRDPSPLTKTILYSHGNAADIGAMNYLQSILCRALHANVIVYDYSGYGESGGIPLESNTYLDIQAIYDYILEEKIALSPANVILYGQSVGSGPSVHLAAKLGREAKKKKGNTEPSLGGLILHSPFMSGMRVLTPSRALACLDIFPNIDRIRSVTCPTMVIHGERDEEVNVEHGRSMHNAVPEEYQREPWWVSNRGHNDITEGTGKMAEYIRRLRKFINELHTTEAPAEESQMERV